jgi:splicing factor 3A subunit 1
MEKEKKNFLKQNVAMIYPPPELKKIVDKVANLVIKYGEEFEEKLKNDENNKKYSFLNKDDPYFLYYSSKIKENKQNKEKNEEFLQKKRKSSNEESKEEKENNITNTNENIIKTPFDEVKSSLNSLFSNSSLEQLTKAPEVINFANIKAPKPDQFIISHPNISELELDIIKITAQFVSKNGQKFLLELSERESKNPQFDFLKPQHNLFGYFTYLVSSYSKILS